MKTSVLNEYKKYFKDNNRISLDLEKDNVRMIAITEINFLFFIDCYYDKENNKLEFYVQNVFVIFLKN